MPEAMMKRFQRRDRHAQPLLNSIKALSESGFSVPFPSIFFSWKSDHQFWCAILGSNLPFKCVLFFSSSILLFSLQETGDVSPNFDYLIIMNKKRGKWVIWFCYKTCAGHAFLEDNVFWMFQEMKIKSQNARKLLFSQGLWCPTFQEGTCEI